jgi:hypothetical protein
MTSSIFPSSREDLLVFSSHFGLQTERNNNPPSSVGEDNSLLWNLPIWPDPPQGDRELTKEEEEELLHQMNCKREDIPGLQELARKHGDTYAGYLMWAAEFTQELVASGAMVFLPDEDS